MALVLTFSIFVSVFLAENALHIAPSLRGRPDENMAAAITLDRNATWENVSIQANDGATLRAWFFRPRTATDAAVILLHGVADTRRGVCMQARMLLNHGYAVLAPDSRAHGVSDGRMVTYGVLEADDVRRWARWLKDDQYFGALYGLGESLGAAILLQSLGRPAPFQAAVAECPFATFEQVALYRMSQVSHLSEPVAWPFVRTAFAYTQLRYGVDLDRASPALAMPSLDAPVLLIHGLADTNIPPAQSRELHILNPVATTLWEVPGAQHVSAMEAAPDEFESRVVGWFKAHRPH